MSLGIFLFTADMAYIDNYLHAFTYPRLPFLGQNGINRLYSKSSIIDNS